MDVCVCILIFCIRCLVYFALSYNVLRWLLYDRISWNLHITTFNVTNLVQFWIKSDASNICIEFYFKMSNLYFSTVFSLNFPISFIIRKYSKRNQNLKIHPRRVVGQSILIEMLKFALFHHLKVGWYLQYWKIIKNCIYTYYIIHICRIKKLSLVSYNIYVLLSSSFFRMQCFISAYEILRR